MKLCIYDGENCQTAGLAKLDQLDGSFRVIIFWSKNFTKLNIDVVKQMLRAKTVIVFYGVKTHGENAMDFHMTAFAVREVIRLDLEGLYIISKDNDFKHVTSYIKSEVEGEKTIVQVGSIQEVLDLSIDSYNESTYSTSKKEKR